MRLMLRQERLRRGWSQEYVGRQAGVTAEAIGMMETGKRKPSYDVLVKLLELFEYNDPRLLFAAIDESSEKHI